MNEFKRPVYIKLKTEIHRGPTEPVERQSMETTGDLAYRNDYYYLIYKEKLEHVGQVLTTLKYKQKEAMIIRQGAISMRQNLILGQETLGTYKHPLGVMDLTTKALTVRFRYDSNTGEGQLKLEYRMAIQGQKSGKYKLVFTIKEVPYDHR